jgi:hypothetical protein
VDSGVALSIALTVIAAAVCTSGGNWVADPGAPHAVTSRTAVSAAIATLLASFQDFFMTFPSAREPVSEWKRLLSL